MIAQYGDPIWAEGAPPVGFQRRCRRSALSECQAQRFIDADREHLQDLERDRTLQRVAGQGGVLQPLRRADRGEGLRRAIERKRQDCLPTQFAAKRGGRKLWCQGQLNRELDILAAALDHNAPMPEPRRLDLPLLPTGQGERFYLERFMREFGEEWNGTAMIQAPTGHQLAVSSLLFTDHKTGRTKINKEGRAPDVPYIAETILRPDEIRLDMGGHGDRTLYLLSRFVIGADLIGVLAVFAEQGRTWDGWTGYQVPLRARAPYFETKRKGVLLYRRTET